MSRHETTYRPLTDAERRAAQALSPGRVTYVPGSPDKLFAWHISRQADVTEGRISEAQAAYLRRMVRRYRRQIRDAESLLAALENKETSDGRTSTEATEQGTA